RLFDSKNGRMLTKQLVLIQGERITDVGAEGQVKIPAGTRVIDLSQATVLPGMIDAHTHMFNNRSQTLSADNSMLIAVSNVKTNAPPFRRRSKAARIGSSCIRRVRTHSLQRAKRNM